jgi:hypothetical protein
MRDKRKARWRSGAAARIVALAGALWVPAALAAQETAVPPAGQEPAAGFTAAGDELVVYLMTIWPGDLLYESFGHNAIWIRDQAAGTDVAYNYGIFDYDQPNFVGRLMRGDMLYSMEGFGGDASARMYAGANRSILMQELNLTPAQRAGLRDFLEWNARPENKFYAYDPFRDNCSTRVRDALDRTLRGQIMAALEGKPTGATYRSHALRLTAHAPAANTGLQLALGELADTPLNAWQETFIPMALAEHVRSVRVIGEGGDSVPLVRSEVMLHEADRAAPFEAMPNRLPFYMVCGLLVALALLVLGRLAASGGAAAVGFVAIGGIWTAVVGFFGLLLVLLWAFTGHAFTYRNENLFHVNPLPMGLAVMLPFVAAGVRRLATPAMWIAFAAAGLSVLGLLLQALPGFDQPNGEVIALVLPAHLVMARILSRRSAPDTSYKMDGSEKAWRERAARAAGRYR